VIALRTSLLVKKVAYLFTPLVAFLFAVPTATAHAQPSATVQALFVSDIHFEPFWDPAKVAKLAAAPVTGWAKILSAPDSSNRQQAFDNLQATCHARGADTAFPLLQSSMKALHSHAAGAKFIILSGDLMAHSFDCKFKTVLPHATSADYRAFTIKTIHFVIAQLQAAAPGVPVYTALGNNDSDCGDYQLDADSAFLKQVGQAVTKHFPSQERATALASFTQNGSYSVTLPSPLAGTRLIVLDDIFLSAKHTACSGKADPAAQDAQYAWLSSQIRQAQETNQTIWVMAHIAPGVDAYSTLSHLSGPCGRSPKMLLSSDRLAQTLEASAPHIKLAIFGHTHEDEIKLLQSSDVSDHAEQASSAIPVKLVPAISPINGNLPSFTVAHIDPATATLTNYEVIAGSDKVAWHQQYEYRTAYGEPSFSADGVTDMVRKFASDHDHNSQPSQNYIHNFSIGNPVPLLSFVWPDYVCAMTNQTAKAFSDCACKDR
jgi:sphingomyelin phosphodiesterase acid-like 3